MQCRGGYIISVISILSVSTSMAASRLDGSLGGSCFWHTPHCSPKRGPNIPGFVVGDAHACHGGPRRICMYEIITTGVCL
jgi:hypothetical protein